MLIHPFSLAGYRSFGSKAQRFEKLGKLNLLIGPNNCGKSNVLHFIHNIYAKMATDDLLKLEVLDRHFPNHAEFRCGLCVPLNLDEDAKAYVGFNDFMTSLLREQRSSDGHVLRVFRRKAEIDCTRDAWFEFGEDKKLVVDHWQDAFGILDDQEIYPVWRALTRQSEGSREQHWFPESLRQLTPKWKSTTVRLIPAIRRISAKEEPREGFGGEGLIERLARLQNPDVHAQADRQRFDKINRFLKSVTDNDSATIDVPHQRNTIIVHMNGKALPLESLGTGIHEVIILAAAATILENTVICMEEPELHLNPILQKKLVRYLVTATSNQYFVTTHSAALMDTPGAEIYHLQLDNGQTVIERVTSDRHRSAVCESLGYHPSDLLQANCIVWVEGPSDRLYLNHWIHARAPELREGIHYSIMFYGGRLASHVTGEDLGEVIEEFISLRRLNRRGTIVIDSDRASSTRDLNATKQRLVAEFDKGPGHAWVTDGREIENYLPPEHIKSAINAILPKAKPRDRFGRYDRMLEISGPQRARQAAKVEVAKYIAENYEQVDETRLNLGERLDALIAFIRSSNPRHTHVAG